MFRKIKFQTFSLQRCWKKCNLHSHLAWEAKKILIPMQHGNANSAFSPPLGWKRESEKPVVVFCCCNLGHFGPSGSRGVEKVFLHHLVLIDEIMNLSKTISGSLMFQVFFCCAKLQPYATFGLQRKSRTFKKYSSGCSKNARKKLARTTTTTIYIR